MYNFLGKTLDEKSIQNRSKQNNPNNVVYWKTRGQATRSGDWKIESLRKKKLGKIEHHANSVASANAARRRLIGNDAKRVERVVKKQLGGKAMVYKGGSQFKRTNIDTSDLDLKIKVSQPLTSDDRVRLGNALGQEFGKDNVNSRNPKIHIVQGQGASIDVVPIKADYFPRNFKIDKLGKNPFSSNPNARHAIRIIKANHRNEHLPGIKIENTVLRIQKENKKIPLDKLIEKSENMLKPVEVTLELI